MFQIRPTWNVGQGCGSVLCSPRSKRASLRNVYSRECQQTTFCVRRSGRAGCDLSVKSMSAPPNGEGGVLLFQTINISPLNGAKTSLNEQVQRNRKRFPNDFMFRLTRPEAEALRSQFAISNTSQGGLRSQPEGLPDSSRWSERSVDHRIGTSIPHPERVPEFSGTLPVS